MDLKSIAHNLIEEKTARVFLIYAFNGTGKTRLSVEYKEAARLREEGVEKGKQTGVYYNAYSEDLFVWDNDIEHSEEEIKLRIIKSSLNSYHSLITEEDVRAKLQPYNPQYSFVFHAYEDDPGKGIEFISFHLPEDESEKNIKLSRGEERIFIWCFFLALIDTEGWADEQNQYIFIDDPVSSLDDHNIFVTAFTLFELIKKFFEQRKIIITTHHIGFATILGNWLSDNNNPFVGKKGKNRYALYGLSCDKGEYSLVNFARKAVWLYHLRMLQVLDKAIRDDADESIDEGIEVYHMAILRQILENISSFLGVGRINYVLTEIGYSQEEADRIALEDNALTHRNVYFPQSDVMVPDNKQLLIDIFQRIVDKYHFDFKTIKDAAE